MLSLVYIKGFINSHTLNTHTLNTHTLNTHTLNVCEYVGD